MLILSDIHVHIHGCSHPTVYSCSEMSYINFDVIYNMVIAIYIHQLHIAMAIAVYSSYIMIKFAIAVI